MGPKPATALLGTFHALERQIRSRQSRHVLAHGMLDVFVIKGTARWKIALNLIMARIEPLMAEAIELARGVYGNTYYRPPMLRIAAHGPSCIPIRKWYPTVYSSEQKIYVIAQK